MQVGIGMSESREACTTLQEKEAVVREAPKEIEAEARCKNQRRDVGCG